MTHGNKNVWVPLKEDVFPWRGEFLATHLVRILSLLLGALTILGTHLAARELFPVRSAVAIGAPAIVAFIPQFLFISSAVSNDTAAAAGAWVLYLTGRMLRRGPTPSREVLLGVILGLAALCKL
ncbi:MAG: glycosyltransferase family 39 protein [Chloroflexota bacterium]|nr:glycosyltransferase family 39 protein [Chloroflexota bacterium]